MRRCCCAPSPRSSTAEAGTPARIAAASPDARQPMLARQPVLAQLGPLVHIGKVSAPSREQLHSFSEQRATPVWANRTPVPAWLALRHGSSPVIIVAPHGGRRQRRVRPGDSVNDLYTAEIAWELAERLDAHALVNHGLDRNEIDLNRISHLADRAPDVLALLRAAVAHVAAEATPLVLFVHGWNMVVPCCDVGVGLKRRSTGTAGRFPTVSRGFFESAVPALEEALSSRGITIGVGRRYSASGRDNAAQLFSGRHREHPSEDVAWLAEVAMQGGVEAAQLELGIPLRWTGPLRAAWIDGVAEVLASSAHRDRDVRSEDTARGWTTEAAHDAEAAAVGTGEAGYALQAVLDERGDVALFCGVEATGIDTMAARFCLVCTDGSMMLLVGEGSWDGRPGCYSLEGLRWESRDDGHRIDLRVDGNVIRYRSHEAYLDLESGLADSELVDARADLTFVSSGDGHGRLTGTIDAGEIHLDVNTTAFLDRGGRRGGNHARVRMLVAPQGEQPARLESRSGDEAWMHVLREDEVERIAIDASASAEAAAAAVAAAEAVITARVPVWRPGGPGTVVRWTFGIASLRGHAGSLPALFDTLEIFDLPPRR